MLRCLVFMVFAATATKTYPVKFKGCYDGDTCTFDLVLSDNTWDLGLDVTQRVIITRNDQKLRLCDINAPEMKPAPNPAAIKAKDDLVKAISQAKQVTVEVAQKPNCTSPPAVSCDAFEKYGRLLGYIVADGVDLNQRQVERKNAVPFILCK